MVHRDWRTSIRTYGILLFLLMTSGMNIVNANLVSRTLVGLGGFLANRQITFRDPGRFLA